MVVAIRIAIGVVVAAIVLVALTPLLVLLDLRAGGSGWGLCVDGVGTCKNSYFSGFELFALYSFVLFALLATAGLCLRLLRYAEKRQTLSEHRQLS